MDKNFYWYTVTTQFETVDDNGKTKRTKENYLVKAVSVTDAETIVVRDFEGTNIDFRILKVDESKIIKVIVPDGVEIND